MLNDEDFVSSWLYARSRATEKYVWCGLYHFKIVKDYGIMPWYSALFQLDKQRQARNDVLGQIKAWGDRQGADQKLTIDIFVGFLYNWA